jgi:hypothetical protein
MEERRTGLISWLKNIVGYHGLPSDHHWNRRYWKNVPGPFYSTTDNLMSLLASGESPRHLIYDDECEFVWRQPTSPKEHTALLKATDCDEVDSYGRDGDERWTEDAVMAWWNRRDELRTWARSLPKRPVKDAVRFHHGYHDAVDAEQTEAYLRFLDEDLEDYLRSYLFKLRHGREPRDGEELPGLPSQASAQQAAD